MKNNEGLIAPTSEKKSPRAGSKAHLESLKPRLDEILKWEQKIKEAKGKEGQILRKEFKDEFGTTFNVKLMEKLTGEPRSLEKKDETPEKFVQMKTTEMNQMVASDIAQEKTRAQEAKVDGIDEFNEQAEKLDSERDKIALATVNQAEQIVTETPDKLQKEKQVEQKDFSEKSSANWAKINDEEDGMAQSKLENEILATKERVLREIKEAKDAELEAAELEEKQNIEDLELTQKQEEKIEKYSAQIVESFKQLSLSPEDLETVPGLVDLPETAQMMIAISLQAMAFEEAKNKANQEGVEKMQGKNFLGRIGQGLINAFKSKNRTRQALEDQKRGGLEKHGADLARLVDWAKTFIPSESINEKGEKQINFISLPSNFQPNPEEKKVVDDFNKIAMNLAVLPKHDLVKLDSVDKESPEYQKAEEYYYTKLLYNEKKVELINILKEHGCDNDKTANLRLNQADAKLNMMQFLAANPDLEKEWEQVLKKDSFFKNAYNFTNEYVSRNAKFFAGGMAARGTFSMIFATTFGAATGFAAIFAAAAGIGAWRAKERANKKLKEQDKFVDKKTLYEHPVLAERKKALHELQSLLPMYSDLAGEEFKNKPGRISYEEWSKIANPADLKKYQKAKAKFDMLDLKWQRTENKNVEKKTLKSDDLTEKLQELINKARNVNNIKDRDVIVGALQRRLDFSKRLADDGLVNFGSIQERTVKMKDFYDVLNSAQIILFNFDYESLNLEYERGRENKISNPEIVKIQERAEDLITYFEHRAGEKLDKKRKWFIIKSMIKGGATGAIFASAGAATFGSILGNAAESATSGAASLSVAAQEAISHGDAIITNTSEEAFNSEIASIITDDSLADSFQDFSQSVTESIANEADTTPIVEIGQSSWSDVISNEGLRSGQSDSVWRSTKEIFLNNAESLGYEGDEAGLSRWAEIQTNKALANSGEIADKVFEGNIVVLEKLDDGFVVMVEQGEGLEPGQLPEVMDRVEPLSSMSTISGNKVVEGASSAISENTSAAVVDYIIPSAKPLEASPAAINKWLSLVGDKFSLTVSEMSYVGNDIIKTVIAGNDIFIDPINDQYYFFDDAGQEFSGFLANDAGNVVDDVKTFFAEKFDLETVDTLSGNIEAESGWSNVGSNGKSFVEEISAKSIIPENVNPLDVNLDPQFEANLSKYPWFKDLYEANAGKNLQFSLKESFLVVNKLNSGVVDKLNLTDISLDNIAKINFINDAYQISLKDSGDILDLKLQDTNLEGENIFALEDNNIDEVSLEQENIYGENLDRDLLSRGEQAKNNLSSIREAVQKIDNTSKRIMNGIRYHQMDFNNNFRFLTSEKGFSILSENSGEKSFFDKNGDGILDRMVINKNIYDADKLRSSVDVKHATNKFYIFDDLNNIAKEARIVADIKPEDIFIADIDHQTNLVTVIDMSDGSTSVANLEQSAKIIKSLQSQYEVALENLNKELN